MAFFIQEPNAMWRRTYGFVDKVIESEKDKALVRSKGTFYDTGSNKKDGGDVTKIKTISAPSVI